MYNKKGVFAPFFIYHLCVLCPALSVLSILNPVHSERQFQRKVLELVGGFLFLELEFHQQEESILVLEYPGRDYVLLNICLSQRCYQMSSKIIPIILRSKPKVIIQNHGGNKRIYAEITEKHQNWQR